MPIPPILLTIEPRPPGGGGDGDAGDGGCAVKLNKKRSFSSIAQAEAFDNGDSLEHPMPGSTRAYLADSLPAAEQRGRLDAPLAVADSQRGEEKEATVVLHNSLIIVTGRGKFDSKCAGNLFLSRLIGANKKALRSGISPADQGVMVRSIADLVYKREGRFVKPSNSEHGSVEWTDLTTEEAIAWVGETLRSRVLAWRHASAQKGKVMKVCPQALHLDEETIQMFALFTEDKKDRYRQLCQLRPDDVDEAVGLLEIPAWPASDSGGATKLRPQPEISVKVSNRGGTYARYTFPAGDEEYVGIEPKVVTLPTPIKVPLWNHFRRDTSGAQAPPPVMTNKEWQVDGQQLETGVPASVSLAKARVADGWYNRFGDGYDPVTLSTSPLALLGDTREGERVPTAMTRRSSSVDLAEAWLLSVFQEPDMSVLQDDSSSHFLSADALPEQPLCQRSYL